MTAVDLEADPIAEMVEAIAAKLRVGLKEDIRQAVINEAGHVLRDVEWRFAQALEREQSSVLPRWMSRRVTAEDLDLQKHMLTGYTLTNNSPSGGSIAWAGLHLVYQGSNYTITDGNTALKFVYWVKATSTTTLQTSNTKPTLSTDDLLVFVNNGGTATVAASDSNQSLPTLIGNNSVDSSAIASGAVTSTAIASGAVTSGAIASGAVGSTQIANGAVGTTQISATAGITGTQLASGTITSTQLGSGSVGSTQLASGAVTSTALASGAVTSTAIASGAVAASNLNILAHLLF